MDWTIIAAGVVARLTIVRLVVTPVWMLLRRIQHFLDDFYGRSDRDQHGVLDELAWLRQAGVKLQKAIDDRGRR